MSLLKFGVGSFKRCLVSLTLGTDVVFGEDFSSLTFNFHLKREHVLPPLHKKTALIRFLINLGQHKCKTPKQIQQKKKAEYYAV